MSEDNFETLCISGANAYDDDRPEEARAAYEAAYNLGPITAENSNLLFNLGSVCEDLGDNIAAFQYFSEGAGLNNNNCIESLGHLNKANPEIALQVAAGAFAMSNSNYSDLSKSQSKS